MTEKHELIENDLLIIPKPTFDKMLRAENCADVIALFMFYYSVAKWQETSTIKATTGFASKGIRISEERVQAAKKVLVQMNLIEDIRRKDSASGQVVAWYIKVKNSNYVHPPESPAVDEQSTLPLFHPVENPGTNALDIYKHKCLKDIKVEYLDFSKHLKDSILKNNPEAKITDAQVRKWADDVRLMIERDGRDLAKMKIVLDWSQSNDFWKANILSIGKFREKYDQLTAQMNRGKTPSLATRERGLPYEIKKRPANI